MHPGSVRSGQIRPAKVWSLLSGLNCLQQCWSGRQSSHLAAETRPVEFGIVRASGAARSAGILLPSSQLRPPALNP